jgi:Domain of unknown function (DUF1905)
VVVDFSAELWIWAARPAESWTFVSLPAEASDEIRDLTEGLRRGFGSVRVRARIGSSTWTTSIFPDSARGVYVLPVKRQIRRDQSLEPGDTAEVTVELLEI